MTCETYVPGVGWMMEPYTLNAWKSDHTSWTLKNGSVLLLGNNRAGATELVTPGVSSTTGFYMKHLTRLRTSFNTKWIFALQSENMYF